MIKVLVVKITDNRLYLDRFLNYLSPKRIDKINKYRYTLDKKRSIIAELLILKMAYDVLGVPFDEIKISYNSYGKPYIDDVNDYRFNVTHSENHIVIAVSKKDIGVDIEHMKKDDEQIAKRFFTVEEYEYIYHNEDDRFTKRFYQIWTLKESYIKALGKGLSIPLNSFEFIINKGSIELLNKDITEKYYFYNRIVDKRYMLSIAYKEQDKIDIDYMDELTLYSYF